MKVVFFEKPGCINNTRQKKLLNQSGCEVDARNLLTHPWSVEELAKYFNGLAIENCFNSSAPRVKSGEVDPGNLDRETALKLMVNDPLLIRRPLMNIGEARVVGFDFDQLTKLTGKTISEVEEDIESCPKTDHIPKAFGV